MSTLGVTAIKSCADYEQLAGGIETLFGAGGAATVQEYAKNVGKSADEVRDEFHMLMEAQTLAMDNANHAYASAGLSANEYTETVTSFAASLKASTANEVEAAEAANQAVIDMSDNANKMGTSMESIQNAYQGFAKQNYTMLDNLKLGYGGTKEEMERLLEDAEKLSGIKYDISSLSDVYSAIHVIQDELGITGTTALEASTTISGSLNAVKASWSNLLVGIADDNQDFDTLVNNFVESVSTAGENLLPRMETTINGLGTLIDSLLPEIMGRVPAIINDVLPGLVEAGINVIGSLINGIEHNLSQIMDCASGIIDQLVEALLEMAPQLVEVAVQLIGALAQGIIDNLPDLLTAAGEIADVILDGIGDLCPALEPVTDAIKVLLDNMDKVIPVVEGLTAAFVAWKAVFTINTLIEKYNKITKDMTIVQYAATTAQKFLNATFLSCPITWIVMGIAALVAAFVHLWNNCDSFRQFWIDLWENIKTAASTVIDAVVGFFTETIPNAISGLAESIPALIENMIAWFSEAFDGFCTWISEIWVSIKEYFAEGWNSIVTFFAEGIPAFIENIAAWLSELPLKIAYVIGYLSATVIKWGVELGEWLLTNIPIILNNVVTFFSELPGKIAAFLAEIIANAIAWGNDMFLKAIEVGSKFVSGVVDFLKTLPGKIAGFFADIISRAANFVTNMITKAKAAGKGFLDGVVDFIKSLPDKINSFLNNAILHATAFVSNMIAKAKEAGKGFMDNIVEAVSGIPDRMREIGQNIVDGIWAGISGGWDWLKNKVSEVANSLLEGAKDALGVHSPSRKFKWIAEMCVAGFDEGMEGFADIGGIEKNVKASLGVMRMSVTGAVTGAGLGTRGGWTQIVNVNQPIATPDELARTLRLENRYGLMRGDYVG